MTCEECARLNLLRKVVTDPVRRAQYENELVRHVNACHPETGSLAAALWPKSTVVVVSKFVKQERG